MWGNEWGNLSIIPSRQTHMEKRVITDFISASFPRALDQPAMRFEDSDYNTWRIFGQTPLWYNQSVSEKLTLYAGKTMLRRIL